MATKREMELAAIAKKALNGENLSEAEMALIQIVELESLSVPKFVLPTTAKPSGCSVCGIKSKDGVLNYCCGRNDCPNRVICG